MVAWRSQTEGFSRLAEGKSTAEMARHQIQQQLSDTKQKCVCAGHTAAYETALCNTSRRAGLSWRVLHKLKRRQSLHRALLI